MAPSHLAFALPCASNSAFIPRTNLASTTSVTTKQHRPSAPARRTRQAPHMLLPPSTFPQLPLTEEQKGPPGYTWDPEFPGTMKPGQVEDNFPLQRVLDSEVYEVMEYQEMDIDERTPQIHQPDDDLLEWLAREGRLLPRDVTDDEIDDEVEKQIMGVSEDDLEYGEDDSKMIAYYSRQNDTAATGGLDFGGFPDSGADYDAGF